jgi:O-antigen/teichoic acid export membrane protein
LTNPILQRLKKVDSAWALADQMVASAGNFATALLLARALPPTEFGTFVLINAACLIAFGFHANLIVSPLVVLGASANGAKIRTYPAVALTFTLALLPVSMLIVFTASASLHREVTGGLAVIYILAWQLQETTRRALFSRLRYREAIMGDTLSYLGQTIIVGLLILHSGITLDKAFAMMAATSLAAAILQCWQVGLVLPTRKELSASGNEFWILGKWMIVVSLMSIIVGPLIPWLLNWLHGKEAVASYQALINVLGLVNPLLLSIPAIVMPAAANFLHKDSVHRNRSLLQMSVQYVLQFETILAPWLLILLFWPHNALILFYGKSTLYVHQTTALRIAVIVYILNVPLVVLGAVLTGAGRTKSNASMQSAGALGSLLCAPPLILVGGVVGAMLADTVTRGIRILFAIRSLGTISTVDDSTKRHINESHICTKI